MKKVRILPLLLFLLAAYPVFCQGFRHNEVIAAQVPVTYDQTVSLVFPFEVLNVDRGSSEVLAQKPAGLKNIVQIKANHRNICPTNLTVITSDGKLYTLSIIYDAAPAQTAYTFTGGGLQHPGVQARRPDAAVLQNYAAMALSYRARYTGLSARNYGIDFALNGIFIHDDYLFVRLQIINDTPVSYEPDQVRFLLRERKKAKRTASQEIEIGPLAFFRFPDRIPAHSRAAYICTLPKFTVPEAKVLFIELTEKEGSRHLRLKIKSRQAGRIITLPYFNK